MEKKAAIIDLGSNSIRLIVMKIYADGSYKMIDQAKEMARLGEGMGDEMTLKPPAMKRALEGLKLFRKLIDAHKVDEILAIATAAVRSAHNSGLFLEKVKEEADLDFRVITGRQEANYAYLGVINTIQLDRAVIVDIGGASTEIVWVEDRKNRESISLPYGTVNLTEIFLGRDTIPRHSLQLLKGFLCSLFDTALWLRDTGACPLVGLGGTFRTLAKMDKKKKGFPLEGIHNYQVSREFVQEAYNLVTTAGMEERAAIPGVDKERADIIPAGFAVINALLEYTKSPLLTISGNGLREGVFFESCLDSPEAVVEDVLRHSIINTLKTHDINIKHSFHVQELALAIFDQTETMHTFGTEERKLLSAAALLHDIGMSIEYYNHHKHGYYLVLNSRINGLSARELVLTAFLVGMHTIDEFKMDWKQYHMLIGKQDYENTKKLSLFLRLAENLDRYGFGNVDGIKCILTGDSLQITLDARHSPELEINAAMKNARQFEKAFGRRLIVVV